LISFLDVKQNLDTVRYLCPTAQKLLKADTLLDSHILYFLFKVTMYLKDSKEDRILFSHQEMKSTD
jgi:hypothetical protein